MTDMSPHATFVTPAWLLDHLGAANLVAVDASFYLPDEGKDADALFRQAHIPGAVFFDIDHVADTSSSLPHMLPDAATFAAAVGALGIADETIVVVYDATDLLGGARAWWMFKYFGARSVHLLEGGLKAWHASGYPVESGAATRPSANFTPRRGNGAVVAAETVLAATQTNGVQIVDARAGARFAGTVPEPRPGLRAGHIPGARNVPWRKLIDSDGRLRPPNAIAATFQDAGIDVGKPIIASCGSGVSAAVLLLGLDQIGRNDAALYDGSWAEWGSRSDLPLETGPAKT